MFNWIKENSAYFLLLAFIWLVAMMFGEPGFIKEIPMWVRAGATLNALVVVLWLLAD